VNINTKIISFVSAFFIIFFILFISFWKYNKDSIDQVKQKRIQEYSTSFNSIIRLMEKSYTSISFENTYWDEMVTFTSELDQEWANENLMLAMDSIDFEYTAVYDTKNLVFYAQKSSDIMELKEKFNTLLLNYTQPTFYNYFIKHDNKIIQVFISPIQPSHDLTRSSKPKGYLLMGKTITKEYISKLEELTEHKVTLITQTTDQKFDFEYALLSLNNKEIASFGINVQSENYNIVSEIFQGQIIIMIMSALLLIISLVLLIYNLIINPLKQLTEVLDGNLNISSIRTVLLKKDEFGTIARSIKNNHEQNHLLNEYKYTVDICNIVSKADDKGNITYVNKKFCDISGYSKEELIGNSHSLIRHEDMDDSVFVDLWKTIKVEKKPWFGIIKNKAKNGSVYYVDSVINPIFDSDGNLIEYIAIRHDITKNEESKNDLKKQHSITSDKYEDILYLSKSYEDAIEESNVILRVDLDENISYANDMFCEVSGYTKEELIGQSYSMMKHPDVEEEEITKIWEVVKSGKIWKGNLKNLSKKGETYYSIATIVPIKNKHGKVIEYIGIRKDITELVNLHNEIEETQRELIYKLGEIGETRSKETGNHVKRVAEYSKLLALKVGLSKEEAELLKYASPMHDIGKIGIADSILNKPGKFTDEEFEVMKNHSIIGYEMLRGSNRPILQTSAIVAHEHHEKWDGTGYPRGLKNDEIHIYGRITAIADVFDALASDRPYKKAWELDKILDLLKDGKGNHFDPQLIELFLNNLDDFLQIKNKFN